MNKRPSPMTPMDADLRAVEPPWDAFIELAIAQFGISRADAERHIENAKAQHRRLH